MKHNHPIWEGHEFNTYKSKTNCYNNTEKDENIIRLLHRREKDSKKLNEWVARPMGGINSSLGKLDIPKDNHGLVNDRTGLVVNHLGEVSKYVKEESISEFVQDVKGWNKRFRNISR